MALCVFQINSKGPAGRGTTALSRQPPSYPLIDAGGGLSSVGDFRGEIVNPSPKLPAPPPPVFLPGPLSEAAKRKPSDGQTEEMICAECSAVMVLTLQAVYIAAVEIYC